MNVKIRRLHADAVVPKYATELAAGFDLVAVENVIVAPGETAKIPIGLAFEIPAGYELQIRPRSGISAKTKLRVSNSPGTVDADFRGEVSVLIDNTSSAVFQLGGNTAIVCKGDRIAQGVIAPVVRAEFTVVDELSETERGEGGFGSTGTGTEVNE